MVSFANKLRQVVAANFVEISRPDTSGNKEAPKPKEPVLEATKPTDDAAPGPSALLATEPVLAVAPEQEMELGQAADSLLVEPAIEAASIIEAPQEPGPSAVAEADPADPMSFVSAEGSVEFRRVFERAAVPASASFTAEQALSMLHSMPSDLPLRVKRLTVKATLDAVGQAVGATPRDIVNDAERKVATLESFIREVSERAQEMRNAEDDEIDRLRARIIEREAEKTAITQREEAAFSACRSRIDDLDQVVAFFTTGESESAMVEDVEDQTEEESDELPAYLQEDAVKRLLGLHGDSGTDSAESDAVGGSSRSSQTRR